MGIFFFYEKNIFLKKALGCLLYKLAFYKTPFEEEGNLAIVNANYKIPSDSPYSEKIHQLISNFLFFLIN